MYWPASSCTGSTNWRQANRPRSGPTKRPRARSARRRWRRPRGRPRRCRPWPRRGSTPGRPSAGRRPAPAQLIQDFTPISHTDGWPGRPWCRAARCDSRCAWIGRRFPRREGQALHVLDVVDAAVARHDQPQRATMRQRAPARRSSPRRAGRLPSPRSARIARPPRSWDRCRPAAVSPPVPVMKRAPRPPAQGLDHRRTGTPLQTTQPAAPTCHCVPLGLLAK